MLLPPRCQSFRNAALETLLRSAKEMPVALKRVYDPPARSDGTRILVDRLWPRGLTKEEAALDLWLRDIAPSNELRRWFHERPTMWPQFRDKYLRELHDEPPAAALKQLYETVAKAKLVTLLFASKNLEHNNATVLKELLDGRRKPPRSTGPERAAATANVARARR
jgi:uncharacterized protein YeaO (DUF488 family)